MNTCFKFNEIVRTNELIQQKVDSKTIFDFILDMYKISLDEGISSDDMVVDLTLSLFSGILETGIIHSHLKNEDFILIKKIIVFLNKIDNN